MRVRDGQTGAPGWGTGAGEGAPARGGPPPAPGEGGAPPRPADISRAGWLAGVISRARWWWAPRSPLASRTAFLRRRRRWRQVRTRWHLRQLREQARADRLERFIERMARQMRVQSAAALDTDRESG